MSAEAPTILAVEHEERSSLCVDFSWMFVGNAVYAAGQFATMMLLTKLVRPELVGRYALGLALVYPVINLTNLQLRAVMTSAARRSRLSSPGGRPAGRRLPPKRKGSPGAPRFPVGRAVSTAVDGGVYQLRR